MKKPNDYSSSTEVSISYKKILTAILVFQVAVILSSLLKVPVLQPVLGFAFYFFVPGVLFVMLIKLETEHFFEKIIYSIVLSVSTLFVLGLLANLTYPAVKSPLSLQPLLAIVNVFVFCLCLLVMKYRRNRVLTFNLHFKVTSLFTVLFAALLPLLAITAAYAVNSSQTSIIPLTVVFAMSAFAILTALTCNKKSDFIIVAAIYAFSLSTLLLFSMRSNYVLGVDGSYENFMFTLTNAQKYWSFSYLPFLYNSCLSVTVFPTVTSSLLSVSGEIIYKVIFQILFALLPVVLFMLFRKFFSKIISFLGVVVFIGQEQFLSMSTLLKQELALLFLGVVLLLLFKKEKKAPDALIMLIFAFSLIVSHYTTTYFAIVLLTITIVLSFVVMRFSKKVSNGSKVSRNFFLAFLVINFFWYLYLFSSPSENLAQSLTTITNTLTSTGFSESAPLVYFQSGSVCLADSIAFDVGIAIKLLMLLGLVFYLFNFRKFKISTMFAAMLMTAFSVVAIAVVFPSVAKTLVISRFMLQATLLLAPMAVIGFHFVCDCAFWVPKLVPQIRAQRINGGAIKKILAIMLVIMYFLVGTNAWSVAFGGNADPFLFKNQGENYEKFYVYPQEVHALTWLSSYNPNVVYCDRYGLTRAVGYGSFVDVEKFKGETGEKYLGSRQVYALKYDLLNDTSYLQSLKDKIIFLRYENTQMKQYKFLYGDDVITVNSTQPTNLELLLSQKQKIYDNGIAEVFL